MSAPCKIPIRMRLLRNPAITRGRPLDLSFLGSLHSVSFDGRTPMRRHLHTCCGRPRKPPNATHHPRCGRVRRTSRLLSRSVVECDAVATVADSFSGSSLNSSASSKCGWSSMNGKSNATDCRATQLSGVPSCRARYPVQPTPPADSTTTAGPTTGAHHGAVDHAIGALRRRRVAPSR